MKVADIRPRLETLGISQAELARRLGVSRVHVTQMLGGKRRMSVATMEAIEAFLAAAGARSRGVEVAREALAASLRFVTLEEARALAADPPPKPALQERERAWREIKELGESLKRAPRVAGMTDDELLGFDEI